ncbi:MAG TPA: LptF/LptG family permease [Thermopetrobacter sp.]|nr:LptF/LptG family permease [Thermopetrobacter sp.]
MKHIALLLSRAILTNFLLMVFGMSLILITIEIIIYLNNILHHSNDSFWGVAQYIWVRLPSMLSLFWPIAMLLATLVSLATLGYRNELTAIWAAGYSPMRLIILLLPLGLALGVAHFVLSDRLAPMGERVLNAWGVGDAAIRSHQRDSSGATWLRAGGDIVRVGRIGRGGRVLRDIIVFRRGDDGLLRQQIHAARAEFRAGGWLLRDVTIIRPGSRQVRRLKTLPYDGDLSFAMTGSKYGHPDEMTLNDLRHYIAHGGYGLKPVHVYRTWWHKRLALLLVAWLMMAAMIPLAVRFRRDKLVTYLFGYGFAIGLSFFIFDRIATTFGEVGLVPPWMAAWFPIGVLGLVAAALVLRVEHVR